MHYLGREYMYYSMWDKCIETLKKHLNLPKAKWKDERCASMRYISTAYKNMGNLEEARCWLYRAIAEAPYLREPYVQMAELAYLEKDWVCVYHMVEEAIKIKERPISYINKAFAWDSTIYDLGAICCYELGLFQRSFEFAKVAVEMSPDDERLKSNLHLIQSKIK